MREITVWFLGEEDPLKKGKATHSSILAWRIRCTTVHGVTRSQTFTFTWETEPCCKKSFHRWPVKAGTSVTPGYPGRKLQGCLFAEGLMDVTWVEVGMGWKRYFWRCNSLWEGFYLNKLWNRTVIVHMDVSRFSVWYISWNVFPLAVFVKNSSDYLVSLLKSMKKLFQECKALWSPISVATVR